MGDVNGNPNQGDEWKRRFRAPRVVYTQIAPAAPGRGLAVSNRTDTYQLYAWDVPTGDLRRLTDTPTGRMMGALSPDGRSVYFLDDSGGNEVGHWARIPFEGGTPVDISPDLPPYSSSSLSFSRGTSLIGFTAADDHGFHMHVMDADPAGPSDRRQVIHETDKLSFGPLLSHNGDLAVVATTERTGHTALSLIAFDLQTSSPIGELFDGQDSSVEPHSFSPVPDDSRILAKTNRTGVNRPVIWNPRTGDRVDIELPELTGDVSPLDWSDDGRRLLLCEFVEAVQRLWIHDLSDGETYRLAQAPAGTFGFYGESGVYFGPTGEIFAQWQDSTQPPQVLALDASSGATVRTVLTAGDVPAGHPWRSVTFAGAQGDRIQAWVATPARNSGPYPMILETHGGPTAVMTETFLPRAQVWLDRGFAYVTVNYHGSTTFGRAFEESIWGRLGDLEVEDMVAARDFIVENGIARPDEIFVTGWSYGGYLTLQALGVAPDLWAAGMAGVAIADWRLQYEDEAETLRGYDAALFGGTPDEKPEAHERASPITYIDRVEAPVLIIQGLNDTRCPPRQVAVYQERMRELGKPCQVHWFDAGHVAAAVEEAIGFTEIMLDFVDRIRASRGESTEAVVP